MTVVAPDGVKAEGAVKVAWVSSFADPEHPQTSDFTDALDMSLTFLAGGFTLAAAQETGEDRRFGSKEVFSELGRVTFSIEDATYVYDPQNDDADSAYGTLKAGTDGFWVLRYGLDINTDWADGQVVDIQASTCGFQRKQPPPDNDQFAKLQVQQSFATQEHYEDVVIGSSASSS